MRRRPISVHRRGGSGPRLAAMLMALVATASCGNSGSAQDASSSTAGASSSSSGAPLSSALNSSAPVSSALAASLADYYDCPSEPEKSTNFRRLTVSDDLTIDAVEFGTGTVGVLLSHQSNGDLCQWHDYALILAQRGYRVIAPTYQADHDVDSALAAIDQLKKDGATSFVLISASMGGTISLAAAGEMKTAPKAVVSLSGPADFGDLDVSTSVGALAMPILFAAGANDGSFAEAARKLDAAAKKSAGRKLLIVPGSSDHGVDLLTDDGPVPAALDEFLGQHAPVR